MKIIKLVVYCYTLHEFVNELKNFKDHKYKRFNVYVTSLPFTESRYEYKKLEMNKSEKNSNLIVINLLRKAIFQ